MQHLPKRNLHRRAVWIGVGLALWIGACATGVWNASQPGPANTWWEGYGPVVPHETFPGDCTLCHLSGDWHHLRSDFTFDHEAQTGVALHGAHQAAQCLRCHNDRGPVQEFAARGCAGCHDDVHQGTQGVRCETCHGESHWGVHAAIADHNQTRFPLVGAHAGTACRQCHLGIERGQIEPLSTACESCHLPEAEQTTSPNHVNLGWVQGCDACHRPTQWGGTGFTHSSFALTGAHAQADCTDCHVGGVFAGTPRDCFACHQTDYQAALDPNHVALGFPTSCQDCHTTDTWQGANFQHAFNIQSGDHSGLDCSECHTIPGSSAFSCIDCHEHRQSEADDEHDDVDGYVWATSACYACHPDGSDSDLRIDRNWRARPHAPQKDLDALERFLGGRRPR